MVGVNGSLLRRLEVVEHRVPTPAPVETVDNVHSFWARVFSVAPEPVQRYFLTVDAELGAESSRFNLSLDPDEWLRTHHPAANDVLEGLARAHGQERNTKLVFRSSGSTNSVAYIQGHVIQWATVRLSMAYAAERPGAGVTTSIVIDREVRERAANDLLDWNHFEVTSHWLQPTDFAERWQTMPRREGSFSSSDRPTSYPDMLSKAGLFDAELALLAADEMQLNSTTSDFG